MTIAEVAIYHLQDEQMYNSSLIIDTMDSLLSTYDGFVSRTVQRSMDDETLLMDYVLWDTLSKAEKAAEQLQSSAEAQPFLEAMTKIEAFYHFSIESTEEKRTGVGAGWVSTAAIALCGLFLAREIFLILPCRNRNNYTIM